MSLPKVCRYCNFWRGGVCTNDLFKVVDKDGYDYNPGAEILLALDMGEMLELLEYALDEDKIVRTIDASALRCEVNDSIIHKLSNLAAELTTPSVAIIDPDSFCCNQWR